MGGRTAVLTILLLPTLAVGAAAQSTGSVSDGFTGRLAVGDCEESGGTFDVEDGVERWRGHSCEGHVVSTDPRFSGTIVTTTNLDRYHGADYAPAEGTFNVWTVERRIENDEGAWQGAATTAAWVDDPQTWLVDEPPVTVVFTGEGGYAGLTAIVTWSERIVPSNARGYIFEGSPPPVPSITE